MKRLLCLIGLHDYIINSTTVLLNSLRVCRRCDREEIVTGYKTKTIWVKYIQDVYPPKAR